MQRTSVLIVGGGPTGLSMALLFNRFKVDYVLVERSLTTTTHPKARGTWVRTMELFRQWGVEDRIVRRGLPDNASGFAFVESMSGHEYGRVPREPDLGQSPSWKCTVSQDVVEEELLDAARQDASGTIHQGVEYLAHEDTEGGVAVTTRDLRTGQETVYHARFLIAADGAGSAVRGHIGIEMKGPASLAVMSNDYWQADLSHLPIVRQMGAFRIAPSRPDVPAGTILNTNGCDKWLTVGKLADGDAQVEPPTEEEVVRVARAHTGIPNLDVKIINRSTWRVSKQIAERYAKGRVFLVGDAAHRFPPTGGYGMNTGIQDAHNLAWKMTLVLQGKAAPSLLASYDLERRPIGQANADFSMGNTLRFRMMDEAFKSKNLAQIEFWIKDAVHHSHSIGLGLGFSYEHGAVIPDGTVHRGLVTRQYLPSDRPGGRYPHLWLDLARRRSTLDLFDTRFVVVYGPKAGDWAQAAKDVGARLGLDIDAVRLDAVDPRDGLEMGLQGAVLVRPDGHVAWRTPGVGAASPSTVLGGVLARLLGTGQD